MTIRPLEPGDGHLIEELFARLGETSRYRRFLSPAERLSEEDLAYLTDVDHSRHEALVALDSEGRPLGVARFVRVPGERDAAEATVAVADDSQGRGIGTALLERLVERSREEGIGRYVALVSGDNEQMREALELVGGARRRSVDPDGVVEYELPLPETGIGELRRALRAARAQPA